MFQLLSLKIDEAGLGTIAWGDRECGITLTFFEDSVCIFTDSKCNCHTVSTYYGPGTVHGTQDRAESKTEEALLL